MKVEVRQHILIPLILLSYIFWFLIDDNTVLLGQVLCCNVFFLAAINCNEIRIFL